jgi:lysylphosphatidylglycerol synthetase-like protein (DUF2156 family)
MSEEAGSRVTSGWGRAVSAAAAVQGAIRFAIRGAPVSIAVLLSVWVLAVLSGTVVRMPREVLRHVGVGVVPFTHGQVWTPITAGLWAPGLLSYVVVTLLSVLVAAPIERRIGSARFAVAALCTQLIGSLVGLAVAAVVKFVDATWGLRLHLCIAVGPTTWIVGVAMVASSRMDALWRRRLRVGLLALLITVALFGGQLEDVIRLAAAGAGWALGPVIVGRSRRGIAGTRRERRVLVAIVVAATAIGPALAVLSPHAVGPLAVLRELFRGAPYSAAQVREICAAAPPGMSCNRAELELRLSGLGPTVMSLMPTLFVVVLGDGLRRGRRFAWLASVYGQVFLLAFSLLNYVVRFIGPLNLDSLFYVLETPTAYRTIVPFLTPLAVLAVLLPTRAHFGVSAPAGTYRKFGLRFAFVVGVAAIIYVTVGVVAGHGFYQAATVGSLIRDFPERLVPPLYLQWIDPGLLPDDVTTTVLYEWVGVAVWVVGCVLLLRTFRVSAPDAAAGTAEQVRKVLRNSGGTALSWMTTWRGNRIWFSRDGQSYVAYRAIGGVALTVSDPVGPRDRLRHNIVEFAEYASSNGWTPCYYSVSGEVKAITDELGWSSIQVAEEMVLDVAAITFKGKRFQDIRTGMNRAAKGGITAEWISLPTADEDVRTQIEQISQAWLTRKAMPEMGFTLGTFHEVDDDAVRCLIAVDEQGRIHGITSWLPVYRGRRIVGWTLDFMRRPEGGFSAAMEFLIASAALRLREEGVEFISLSGAPLAKVHRPAAAGEHSTVSVVLDRLLDLVGRMLEPVYGFRSLHAFKAKFRPTYAPMYMTFPDHAALVSIGNAISRAYLPKISVREAITAVGVIANRVIMNR